MERLMLLQLQSCDVSTAPHVCCLIVCMAAVLRCMSEVVVFLYWTESAAFALHFSPSSLSLPLTLLYYCSLEQRLVIIAPHASPTPQSINQCLRTIPGATIIELCPAQ
jgi:hypothetical protein